MLGIVEVYDVKIEDWDSGVHDSFAWDAISRQSKTADHF